MEAETQAFLDEAKSHRALGDVSPLTPDTQGGQTALVTIPYISQGAKAWWQRAGLALEEMARHERLLLDAIAAELDANLRGHLETQLGNVRTVIRLGSEMQRQAGEFRRTYQQYVESDTVIRTAATALGYTV